MDFSEYQSVFTDTRGNEEFPDDCERICAVARNRGLFITQSQAGKIWRRYSGINAAGWLFLRDDEEIEEAIASYARSLRYERLE